jgi:hypothetical protein
VVPDDHLVRGISAVLDLSWVLIVADASKQRSIPGKDWDKNRDPEAASRAVKEYLATLDDAAFGAASDVTPKFANRRPSRSLGPSAPPNLRGGSSINLREYGVKASETAKARENSYFHHRLIGLIDEPFRTLNAGRPCYRARTRL